MDVTSHFSSQSVSSRDNLNWVFLVDWILAFVSCVAVIFYFNRAMAWCVSTLLNFLLWKRHKVRYKVSSFKISYLGGRVFFKNLTIISNNEIVFVHQGWFTWRYWLGASRKSELRFDEIARARGDSERPSREYNESLPTRFAFEAYGVEVFMYNRTQAYDSILSFLNKTDEAPIESDEPEESSLRHRKRAREVPRTVAPIIDGVSDLKISRDLGPFSLLRLLPIEINIRKVAFVLGNEKTSSLMVSNCSSLTGDVSIAPASNQLDLHRMVYNYKFAKLATYMRPNLDNTQNLARSTATLNKTHKQKRVLQRMGKLLASVVVKASPGSRKTHTEADVAQKYEEMWPGLKRYLLDDTQEVRTHRYESFEYAKFSQMLESEYTHMVYFYETPGKVPGSPEPTSPIDGPDVGNGGPPPLTGLDIWLSKPIIHYGPWAERQRSTIHKAFFPSACRDALPFDRLCPGDERVYTGFKLNVDVVNTGTLIIPFREGSKNSKYLDQVNSEDGQAERIHTRPFGWLELSMGPNTTVQLYVSYVPTKNGWENRLELDTVDPKVSSSVNHDVFFSAGRHTVVCDIGYPLSWNGHTFWTFENTSLEAKTFFLREHVTLMVDMLDDFSSGDPVAYELFRPFTYKVRWSIKDFGIFLNINDFNIIDNSADFNDNSYVSFKGDEVSVEIDIPLESVVKTSNTVTYRLNTEWFELGLDTPPWHTTNNFLKHKTVGHANNFEITGSYTYFSMVDIDSVDNIVIACTCDDTTLECYGFIVRYIMVIKENYFGDHVHFQTASEFTESRLKSATVLEAVEKKQQNYRTENETDVLFSFCVNNGALVLPAHLYDCDSHVALHFDSLDIDIRFTNYYMDMQADFSPVIARLVKNCDPDHIFHTIVTEPKFAPDLFIDGLAVHGHRMFGLPPVEPTYFCRWDFVAGEIVNHSSCEFIDGLGKAVSCLAFGYKDVENALITEEEIIYDVVALSFSCPKVDVLLKTDDSVLRCELRPIDFKFNDLNNKRYTSRMSLDIPVIKLTSYSLAEPEKLTMAIETSLKFSDFIQKEHMDFKRHLQQHHIQSHDAPYHRSPFILERNYRAGKSNEYSTEYGRIKPSFSIPDLPYPLNEDTVDILLEDLPSEMVESFSDDSSASSFSSSESTSEAEASKPIMAGDGFETSLEYDDKDFTPQVKPDPNFEYDNFIVNIGSVRGYASPAFLETLLAILQSMQSYDVKGVLDSLHVDIVNSVMRLHSTKCEAINIRVVVPVLSLRFGDFTAHSVDEAFSPQFKLPDHIVLEILNPSLVTSVKTTRYMQEIDNESHGKVEQSLAGAVHLREAVVGVKEAGCTDLDEELAVRLSLQDLEFWFTDNDAEGFTGSLNIRIFDNAVESKKLSWLGLYASKLQKLAASLSEKYATFGDNARLSRIELMYLLSTASVDYRVQHDPTVITKPSNVIRTSKNHIRYQDSWKVVTRLRHVVDNVPQSWCRRTDAMLRACKWEAGPTAKSEVLNIFSRWRTWEFSKIEQCYIFKFVFDGADTKSTKPSAVQFSLESFALRLSAYDLEDDYVRIDYISFGLMSALKRIEEVNRHLVPEMDPEVYHTDISISLSYFRSKFSLHCLRLMDFLNTFESLPAAKAAAQTSKSEDLSKSFSVSFFLESFDNKVELSQVSSNVSGKGLTVSAFTFLPQESDVVPLNVSLQAETISNEIHLNNMTLMGGNIHNGNLFVSSVGSLETGLKNVLLQADSVKMLSGNTTDDYVAFVDALLEDELPRFDSIKRSVKKFGESKEKTTTSDSDPLKLTFPLAIRAEIKSLDLKLQFITPLSYVVLSQNALLKGHLVNGVLVLDFSMAKASSNLNGAGHSFIRADLNKFSAFFRIRSNAEHLSLETSLNMDQSKLSVPRSVESVRVLYKIHESIAGNFAKLKSAFSKLTALIPSSPQQGVTKKQPAFVYKIESMCEYMAILVSNPDSKLTLESHRVGLSCCNFAIKEGSTIYETRPHGWIKFPSTKFIVAPTRGPLNRFDAMEVDVELKLLEPENGSQKYQAIQIVSNNCRFVLNASVLIRILRYAHAMREAVIPFLDLIAENSKPKSVKVVESPSEPVWSSFSIHILSYNMCIGWLFEEQMADVNDIPGLIAGYEKAYITSAKGMGKVSMVAAYISRAHGDRPDNFYSIESEIENLDRAFFPGFQLTYVIAFTDSGKRIRTRLRGEQLDFRLRSHSLLILDKLWRSFTAVEKVLKQLEPLQRKQVPRVESADTEDFATSLGINFFSCLMTFDGASISISRPNDTNEKSPLFLKAPAVNIASEYHKATSGKHVLNWEVLTSSSSNTVYAACVPVLLDVYRGCKSLMESTQPPKPEPKLATKPEPKPGFDISNLVSMFDVSFALRIEPQTLSLSCEPTAKVEAIVSFDGLDIHFNTIESSAISGALEIENIAIRLQHVYSRQTSGSILIKDLLVSGVMSSEDGKGLVTNGSVSDVDGYVNVTQLQDLDLFKDIWLPHGAMEEYSSMETKEDADAKTFGARMREVSSTTAFPWFLNFSVLNVGFTVDLGKSLGVVTMTLDKMWAFSRKTVQWEQNFKMEFNSLLLTSKGRLGGELELRNLKLHSAIAWEGDLTESIPSVLLFAGFDSLQAKAAFDFHTFFIANIERIYVDIYNQKAENVLDSLVASGHVGSIQLYLTALAASNFLEIWHTIQRMRHDIRLSYNEVLHDSAMLAHDERNTGMMRARSVVLHRRDLKNVKPKQRELEQAIVKLKTALDVAVEAVDIHVYPSSLLDSQVLVIQLGSARAAFSQDQLGRLESRLNLKLEDVKVALSSLKTTKSESFMQEVRISDYVKHAKTAKGGTIFVFPSLAVSMSTAQAPGSNTIEYVFRSCFGGKVDVRWNLGSINFIREMWTVHANALSTRLSTRRVSLGDSNADEVMNNSTVLSIFETVNIEDRLKTVEGDKKFVYVPLVEPEIETPQLKELGDATPPLEWFGLHRDKFPNLTHQVIIMGLQKMVTEAEKQYARVLK